MRVFWVDNSGVSGEPYKWVADTLGNRLEIASEAQAAQAVLEGGNGSNVAFLNCSAVTGAGLPALFGELERQDFAFVLLFAERSFDNVLHCLATRTESAGLTQALPGDGPDQSQSRPRLTNKELEVLKLLCQGHSNNQLATSLGVSVGTVKTHMNRILNKLGVSNRTQALSTAAMMGLVSVGLPRR